MGLYADDQLLRLKGTELADKGIKYFTQARLKETQNRHEDFFYQPVKSKGNAGFPWMVAELKKENEKETVVLNQAANASHTCIVLCEQLAELGARDLLPIVAFTSIGPQAKVFVAYKSETADDQSYVCYSLACIPSLPHQLTDVPFWFSECLAYGVVMLEICCMPSNFGA